VVTKHRAAGSLCHYPFSRRNLEYTKVTLRGGKASSALAPQRLKPGHCWCLMARLKSCPDTDHPDAALKRRSSTFGQLVKASLALNITD